MFGVDSSVIFLLERGQTPRLTVIDATDHHVTHALATAGIGKERA